MPLALSGWTIVFDLDGTLVETAPDLLNALNHTLARDGLPPVELAVIRTMIGDGAKAMIRKGYTAHGQTITGDALDRAWTCFIDHYLAHIADESHLFDGVIEALDALSANGATLAVATNKAQALADEVLAALGLTPRFAAVLGPDSVSAKKPDGAHVLETIAAAGGTPDRAVFIGDSRTDEKAALNAGLPFIFLPFGYEAAVTDDVIASRIVHHYSDLVEAVSAIAA